MPLVLKSQGMIPPGGWKFDTPHGELRGASVAELSKRIADYREANLLEPGDPLQELTDQLCAKWPTWCRGWPENSAYAPPPKASGSIVKAWLAKTLYATRGGGELVDPVVAMERAEVCTQCPMHQKASFCCGGTSAARIIAKKITRARNEGNGLVQCAALGYDCYAAVNLPISILPDASKAPDTCWLRKERNQ